MKSPADGGEWEGVGEAYSHPSPQAAARLKRSRTRAWQVSVYAMLSKPAPPPALPAPAQGDAASGCGRSASAGSGRSGGGPAYDPAEPLFLYVARRRLELGVPATARRPGRLHAWLHGPGEMNPQEALLWMGSYGPTLHMHIIRTSGP